MNFLLSLLRLFFTIGLIVLGFVLLKPTNLVLWQSCQPMYLTYANDVRYCSSIVQGGFVFNFYTARFQRQEFLFISPEIGDVTNGHFLEYQFHGDAKDSVSYFEATQAVWSDSGVEITEKSGHRLFAPYANFSGSLK